MHQGKSQIIPAKDVDAFMNDTSNMFSFSTNLIPYLPHDSGNRAAMASRMLGQAVPIQEREAPHVQSQ